MLTAGVASADETNIAQFQASLEQTGLVQSVVAWKLAPEQYPQSSAAIPDVVLLELTRDADAPLSLAAHLHRLRPSVCIIACSSAQQPTPELLMRAMRSGVREILPQPIDPELLHAALERLMKEHGVAESAVEKLIVVVGAKGGSGATTVAVNLAVQIARQSGKRTALFDLARPLGQAWLQLGVQPRFSVRNAIDELERLDGHLLGGFLTAHESGLQLLAGTSHAEEWQYISAPGLVRLANVAQSNFDHVVLDLGSFYSSDWAPLFRLARNVVLTAEADVPGLWALERHLKTLSGFGIAQDKVRVVVNRWHRSDDEAVKVFEKKSKQPVFARLPNDFLQVSDAVNRGAPLSRNHNDPLVTKYRSIAAQLAGLPAVNQSKQTGMFTRFALKR
ncbi:MAG: hypothetical protein HYX72_00360 [Acidobacteria bacterium]|nr:hypothetical protein [Acidobacteriota bacterium]